MADAEELARLEAEVVRLREELVRSYKDVTLSRLAAGIFHEMNSPIASIFSNNEVLRKSVDALEKSLGGSLDRRSTAMIEMIRSLLEVDRVACERISGIVRSLKVHARVENEGFGAVKLNDLVDDSIRLVNAEYRRRVKVETNYGELPLVECNPQRLSQVLLNILINAAQAIECLGTITVRTALDGEMALISIQDTGAGISEDCRKRIFVTSFSTKPVGVGTGLGLPISRKIVVEEHGGKLDFESELGKGTTFHIRIPVRRPAPKESR